MGSFSLEEFGTEIALFGLFFAALTLLTEELEVFALRMMYLPSLQVHMSREKALVVGRAAEGLPALGLLRSVDDRSESERHTGSKVGLWAADVSIHHLHY